MHRFACDGVVANAECYLDSRRSQFRNAHGQRRDRRFLLPSGHIFYGTPDLKYHPVRPVYRPPQIGERNLTVFSEVLANLGSVDKTSLVRLSRIRAAAGGTLAP